ncbi:MAG TPA: uroporphyrinogen decarboxylase family protein [Armatimonadota bacterium]
MTPREIIYANLAHANPDRPGLTFSDDRINDMRLTGPGPSLTFQQRRWTEENLEYYDDEWGNLWYRMLDGCASGEIHTPAITDWDQLDTLKLPDFDDPRRYDDMRALFAQPGEQFKVAGVPGWVFASSRYLRKMEVYFVDLGEYPDEIARLHEIVTGLLERAIKLIAESGADGIFFCEDLGIQDRLLIGPSMWREVFKPHYRRLTDAAHAYGMKVFMHSCGYNWELIDDLVEAGIDCFQFDQPAVYDMPALAEKLRQHHVALWAPIDIQQVLPTGDRARIEAEAEKMVRIFQGGLIMKNYPDLPGIGVKAEWDEWGYQALLRAAGITPVEA